jgi:hypothetical protein
VREDLLRSTSLATAPPPPHAKADLRRFAAEAWEAGRLLVPPWAWLIMRPPTPAELVAEAAEWAFLRGADGTGMSLPVTRRGDGSFVIHGVPAGRSWNITVRTR